VEDKNYQIDFIEIIGLLKDLNEATPKLAIAIDKLGLEITKQVAPVVNIEPTPVVVNEREIPNELKAEITNLEEVEAYLKTVSHALSGSFKISNLAEIKQAKFDVSKVEALLKKISEKKELIEVKVEPNVTVDMPTGYDPQSYIPVRLTDGKQFYNALATLASGGKLSANAQTNLERLSFNDAGELVVSGGSPDYVPRVDNSNPVYLYIGMALPSANPASAVWQIKRFDISAGLIGAYADGNADFDNVWNDRNALTYI
jgi:hypothetical protein